MLISRTVPILKAVCNLNARKNAAINLAQVRNVKLIYRSKVEPSKFEYWTAEIITGVFWWWVFWFLYHDWDNFSKGHIPGPIPEIFSDEELGIPPDD
ncbi:NADH dehydrogenase (ubiquinone) 1 beta subcomplex, 2, 8kDa [Lasioglossum baleicum]|uniref:NADH dehydrogenase (ubiquinone) 1 beta subcomplex, 2, 8kDa n=1 Tax=Lasioglossum baleicum TaxID=434251 RepID=UPI003FCD86EB